MNLSPLWLLGWRCLHALALAVFPWAPPLDALEPSTLDGAMLRALAGWIGVASLLALGAWRLRSWPQPAYVYLALTTLVGALVAALLLPRESWPLGASMWALAPLAWATLFARAAHRVAPARRASSLARVAALCAVTFALSATRIHSIEAMWTATTAHYPSHARAWRALARRASARGDHAQARTLLDRCLLAAPPPWECALDRAELSLRAHDHRRTLADSSAVLAARADHPRALTLRALALARQTPVSPEAREAAQRALQRAPRSAEAHLALALALDAAGLTDEARTHAQTARTLGGGDEVLLLQSLLALRAGDSATARADVERVLRGSAGDARAHSALGLVEQQAGRYNAAREAYLRALQLDRGSYTARYNLAALTFGAGAVDEARHHIEALLRDHPGDPAGAELLRRIAGASAAPR